MTLPAATERQTEQCIRDFGSQWTDYTDNSGYYASVELFNDIVSGLLTEDEVKGARVADIGSGSGRIVGMLLGAGAAHVTAIEPSAAMDVLKQNLKDQADKITFVQQRGEAVGECQNLDLVFSFGVIHHIPDPAPVVAASHKALKQGGKVLYWLYGHEGNELYLAFIQPLRAVTQRMPDFMLKGLCHAMNVALHGYLFLCRKFSRLPMRAYMLNMIGNLTPAQRYLTIYDQLNPAYAKYYTRDEVLALLHDAGFADVQIAHRHGYSWTVVGTKA